MARKHPLTEGKKNIIAALLQEYDIQSMMEAPQDRDSTFEPQVVKKR